MMKKRIILLLALPLWAFAGTSTAETSTAELSPIVKSPLDPKEYRAVDLDNGLKVLLVSDPATDKSAAALDVHIGNGSDPDDWQGLAHFLEHMLFLGSKKYPGAGEYKSFIDDHGGSHNAYTSFDHTNYYFDISSDYLRPALDRFSRFFIDPTFDPTFVNRERSVVHSEYQARLKDESRRLWAARRQLVNPAHPLSRFAVGSEHTLRDRDGITARQKLLEFYNRHYSADLMTLTVVGAESLDQLEQWVTQLFAEIPDRDASAPLFRQPYLNRQLVSSRLDVVPQKDTLRVSFLFPIPSTEAHYRSKPLGYVANLLGHEGEGSLLALLDSLGWAEGLSAGAGYMDKVQGTFEVSVQLTEAGLRHIDEIGALLFQYIDLIRAEGVQSWRYDEQRRLAGIAFRFAEEHEAGAAARWLAAVLHRYPTGDVLRGPYMMEDYRPELIEDLLSHLRPDNVLLQVVSRDARTSGKTPFYEVDFGIQPIPQSTIERWKKQADKRARDERLALPPANRFIPARLAAHALETTSTIPRRLDSGHGISFFHHSAWYRGDPQFGTPRAAFYFSVKTPLGGNSARNLVLTELFVRMVNKQLDTAGYPALLAGLNYQLYRHGRGFSVRISGYEDKQPLMLKTVLEALFTPHFERDQLASVVAELKREWNNIALEAPSTQSVHEVYRLLMRPYWSEAERLAVIDRLDVDQLAAHAARLLEKAGITTLSHGDVTPQRAVAMNQMLAAAFAGSEWLDEVERPVVRMLNDDRAYLRSLDVDHRDSALAAYFQGRHKTDLERAKMSLLARLMEAPFFFQLRTTKRVGYLVHASPLPILQVPGLLFSVQSPTHTPTQIDQLINQFLDEFEQILKRMEEDNFAQVKQGLIARILAQDKKLTDRTNYYWREIDRREFEFDSRRRLAGLIESLDKNDILSYFQRQIKAQPRKLLVQSPGRREQAAGGQIDGADYTTVRNTIEFRKSAHAFFPAW